MKKLKQWGMAALNENFTFLGFFVAWVVLEGSAKTVVGYVTIASVVLWFVTIGIREKAEKEE
jgi:predicted Co/Zn/Cd cation transporter (cation efflux family)